MISENTRQLLNEFIEKYVIGAPEQNGEYEKLLASVNEAAVKFVIKERSKEFELYLQTIW